MVRNVAVPARSSVAREEPRSSILKYASSLSMVPIWLRVDHSLLAANLWRLTISSFFAKEVWTFPYLSQNTSKWRCDRDRYR